jgi:hypothetical protein
MRRFEVRKPSVWDLVSDVLKTLVFATLLNHATPRNPDRRRAPGIVRIPEEEAELIRLYTLTKSDLAFVRQHRGQHNRLGIAVQMSYLQFPGRVLGEKDKPSERLLNFVATQLEIAPDAWTQYAARDETRREHLAEPVPAPWSGAIRNSELSLFGGVAGTDRVADNARHGACSGHWGGTP